MVLDDTFEHLSDRDDDDPGRPNLLDTYPNVQFVVNAIHDNYESVQGYIWKNTVNIPDAIPFNGHEQILIKTNNQSSCSRPHSNIFDNSLLDKIVAWTNKRAEVLKGSMLPKQSVLNKWSVLTRDEFKKYLRPLHSHRKCVPLLETLLVPRSFTSLEVQCLVIDLKAYYNAYVSTMRKPIGLLVILFTKELKVYFRTNCV